MKRTACFLISIILLICCLSCTANINSNKVIKVLRYSLPNDVKMDCHIQSNGDFDLGWDSLIQVEWTQNGGLVTYDKNLCVAYKETTNQIIQEKEYVLLDGEQLQLTIYAVPYSIHYRILLCDENDPLPEEWIFLLENMERIKKAQEQYGTYEEFITARKQDTEKALIEQAQINAGWTENHIERDYDMFLHSLWVNGDTDVKITDVSTWVDVQNDSYQYEPRFIRFICNDGNTYDVAADYLVLRNGMQYYGPAE